MAVASPAPLTLTHERAIVMASAPVEAGEMAVESAPLRRERKLIVATLFLLALAAWALVIWQASQLEVGMPSLTMGLSATLFLSIWILMMVAMMFPTAAPMIVMFARVSAGKRQREQPFVPTWVFVAAYLAVWTTFGMLAYGVAVLAEQAADQSSWLMDNAARIGGGLLVLAGLYQLSPLKRACLAKCRSPLAFVLTAWRDGHGGAFRMGLEHGLYCLGCCWLLFAILFPLGVMNVVAMAALTLLIFMEKSTPLGSRCAVLAAVALVVYGAAVIAMPGLLPTAM